MHNIRTNILNIVRGVSKRVMMCMALAVISSSLLVTSSYAQRHTDRLNRGLVAVKKQSGVFVSWRINADEYYGVKYNIYRNGVKLNSKPLNVSNYTDAGGNETSTYSVSAVVNGVEQAKCPTVKPWNTGRIDKSNKALFPCPAYYPIKVADVKDRNGNTVWKNENGVVTKTIDYTINDISLGDIDGDGDIEFIVKRKNQDDQNALFPTTNNTAFCRLEAYDTDGTLMWYIDCGPNIVYGADEQWDAVAYDWDQDGQAEVLLRGCDNMIIHKADGTTYNVGDMKANIRGGIKHVSNMTFTNSGAEYLIYLNGKTGAPYWVKDYPLPRGNAIDWGDDYGHRSSKYFIGAPFLDGKKASIYLGRGIYTKTEMVAYDVDPATHELTQLWRWSSGPSGPWYGQGNHNYAIADVDEDGCDEIIYGSMVIDNNGKGLSTTALGHGDASHTGDLDPFRKGLETFACNEDHPGNNFRNATTCEIYFRQQAGDDDGRAMAGNFSNDYPGSWGASASSGIIALSADQPRAIDGLVNKWNQNSPDPIALNFRIFWDGDLLSETVNGPGSNEGDMFVDKMGARIIQTSGVACINGTKKNPCAQGDILGDWREELIFRSYDNTEFRIYTTTDETSYRIPSLWYDHEYRQAMVWQSEGYNQPPHVSFFLGELEGYTVAPPPLTYAGRTEVANNSTISSALNGKQLLISDRANMKIGIDNGGIAPEAIIINVPSNVAGNGNNNNIFTSYYESQLGLDGKNGDITGATQMTKQGDGLLKIAARTYSYTGNTDIWGGSVAFNGKLTNSPVWMNHFTTLYTAGTFNRAVSLEYGAAICPNSTSTDITQADYATATIDTLNLKEGSRIIFQIDAAAGKSDHINMKQLKVEKKNWQYGPKYLAPVLQIASAQPLANGDYLIGAVEKVVGNIDDIIIESSLPTTKIASLVVTDGKLYLNIKSSDIDKNDIVRHPENSVSVGNEDNTTGWWGEHSEDYVLRDGQKLHLEYRNYGLAGGEVWNNAVIVFTNDVTRNDEANGYVEYAVIRSDNNGWGTKYKAADRTYTSDWGGNFQSYMNGALVAVDVTYDGGNVLYEAKVTSLDGHTRTDKYAMNSIAGDMRVFLTVDKSHIAIDLDKTAISNLYNEAYRQTFETASDNNYGFRILSGGVEYMGQATLADGNNIFHAYQGNSNDRTVSISFANIEAFNSTPVYKFEFDAALIGGNQNATTLAVVGENGNLFTVSLGAWATEGTIKNAEGKEIGKAKAQAYTKNVTLTKDFLPTEFNHYILKGNTDGVTLMVMNGNTIVIPETRIADYSIVKSINTTLGRYYAHVAYDNIKLNSMVSDLTLSDKIMPTHSDGQYNVTMNRNLVAGFNSFCIPINTTPAALAGEGAKAYYLESVEDIDGYFNMTFRQTDQIKANEPYLLYAPQACAIPAMTNVTVAAAQSVTKIVDGWSFVSNYEPNHSTYGNYVISGGQLKIGGASSFVNGMRAYFIAPAGANVKGFRLINSDDIETAISNANTDAPTAVAYYTIDGRPVSATSKLASGTVCIVRMSDGSAKKIVIK